MNTRPGGLGWLYLLLVASALALGANVGALLYLSGGTALVDYLDQVARCSTLLPGGTLDALNDAGPEVYARFAECLEPAVHAQGIAMAVGAATVAATGGALVALGPGVERLLLRRRLWRGGHPDDEATERFTMLCEQHGIPAAATPRLVVAAPPLTQAFTSSVPRAGTWVVVPAALLSPQRADAFDAVVRHELGHVRARDSHWVSAVRGLRLLILPALLVTSLPALDADLLDPVVGSALLRGALLSALLLIGTAAVLRGREITADAVAVRHGGHDALVALLESAPGSPSGRLRRVLARHPTPGARLDALREGSANAAGATRRAGEFSPFVRALAVGTVAALAAGAARAIALGFTYRSPHQFSVWAAVITAGLLLALAPGTRRGGSQGDQRRTALGVGCGLLLGGFVTFTLNGSALAPTAFLLPVVSVPWSLAVAVVTAAVCAGVACLVPGRLPTQRFAVVGRPSAGCLFVAVLGALSVVTPGVFVSGAALLATLTLVLPRTYWPLLAVALPVLAGWPRGRRPGAEVVALAALAAATATVCLARWTGVDRSEEVNAESISRVFGLYLQDAMACALAGMAAFCLVVLREGRRPALAGSAALAVTGAAGSLVAAGLVATGRSGDWSNTVRMSVLTPLSWIVLLVPIAALLITFWPARAVDARRWTARRWTARPRRRAVGLLPWLAAGVGAGLVGISANTLVVASTVLAPGPAGPATTASPPTSVTAAPSRSPARQLTQAEADRAAGAVEAELPVAWQPDPAPDVGDGAAVSVQPPSCGPYAGATFTEPLRAAGTVSSQRRWATAPAGAARARSTLTVTVWSSVEPVAAQVFSQARRAEAGCDSYALTDSPDLRVTVLRDAQTAVGGTDDTWRARQVFEGGPFTATLSTVFAAAGRTVVEVSLFAFGEANDPVLLDRAATKTVADVAAAGGTPSGAR